MWWIGVLAACSGMGDSGSPDTDTDTGDDTLTEPCASGSFGVDGGTLEVDGASVEIPSGALDVEEVVQLCALGGDPAVFEVTPASLALASPLLLTVEHTGPADSASLYTPSPDGTPWLNLQATGSADQWTGPLYRGGQAWVAEDGRVVEPYEPIGSGMVDLIFVVDDSCSMYDEQADLVSYFPIVGDFFDGGGLDYHVGVVSTDLDNPSATGRLREDQGRRWIDPSTPDARAAFAAMATLGTTGSGQEQGLGAAYMALEILRDSYNAGFLREEAALGIVVVSDEDDQTTVVSPAEVVEWLDVMKGTPDATALHGIVSPPGGGVYSGDAYIQVAQQTGGEILDIRETDSNAWAQFLGDVADSLAASASGHMPLDAVEDTVEGWWVPVDGEQEPLDGAVDHDPVAGSVVLDIGDLPEAEIFVVYEPLP